METGATGSTGATGATGVTGATGTLSSAYGFICNTGAQTVAVGSDVIFSNNGPLLGIGHTAGTSIISINNAGTYIVTFHVNSDDSNQFALFLGGTAADGGRFGVIQSGASVAPNYGQVTITVPSGATATLNNNTSSGAVSIPANAGGSSITTNASINIHRID